MKIVIAKPPMFEEIDAKFKIADKDVIFAWGDRIFNPKNLTLPPAIIAHECVHGERQGRDVEFWWRRYIEDEKFRLDEEVLAHRAEYLSLVNQFGGDRNTRRRALAHVGLKLCHPIYGRMVSLSEAKKLIAA